MAFGGKLGGVFGVASDHGSRFSLARLEPLLEAAHERLDGVVFENLEWKEVLTRYDSPQTLFYLDPPYWGGEADYGKGLFHRDQFAEMARLLSEIRGAFILSINDRPEIREIFAAFVLEPVQLKYTVSKGEASEAKELIISNREARVGLL